MSSHQQMRILHPCNNGAIQREGVCVYLGVLPGLQEAPQLLRTGLLCHSQLLPCSC